MPSVLTVFPSLLDIDTHVRKDLPTWEALVEGFSDFTVKARKEDVPLFGPYVLKAPDVPCRRHKSGERTKAHRCDRCVDRMTLAVFDADQGTMTQVEACRALLQAAGVAHLWYSTFNYDPTRPTVSARLLVPLARPESVDRWYSLREILIDRFQIPADPQTSSGLSHSYYLPSHRPGATPWFSVHSGVYLDPATVFGVISRPPIFRGGDVLTELQPDEDDELEGPVDLGPLREKVRVQIRRWSSGAPRDKERAHYLQCFLDGAPLADHGERDVAMLRACGVLAWLYPDEPLTVLMHLVRPTMNAMMAAGSRRITPASVRHKILSARTEARAEYERRANEEAELIGAIGRRHY
jgi:hypothetical protein